MNVVVSKLVWSVRVGLPDERQEIIDMPFEIDLVDVEQLFDGIGPSKCT
jgi:hypothetical protein